MKNYLLAVLCALALCCSPPPVAAQRTLMTFSPTYSSGTTYAKGDGVIVGGVFYVSLIPNNTANPPASSPAAWAPLGAASNAGSPYSVLSFGQGAQPPLVANTIQFYSPASVSAYQMQLPGSLPDCPSTFCVMVYSNTGNSAVGRFIDGEAVFGGGSFTVTPTSYAGPAIYAADGATYLGGTGCSGASTTGQPVAGGKCFLQAVGGLDLCINALASDTTCGILLSHSTNGAIFHYAITAPGFVGGAVTFTPASGVGTVACVGFCNSLGGLLSITGGTATTGNLVTVTWPATARAEVCTASQNGGSTFYGIGHIQPTTTGMVILNAAASVASTTVYVDYACQLTGS